MSNVLFRGYIEDQRSVEKIYRSLTMFPVNKKYISLEHNRFSWLCKIVILIVCLESSGDNAAIDVTVISKVSMPQRLLSANQGVVCHKRFECRRRHNVRIKVSRYWYKSFTLSQINSSKRSYLKAHRVSWKLLSYLLTIQPASSRISGAVKEFMILAERIARATFCKPRVYRSVSLI